MQCLQCNGENEHYSDVTPLFPPNCKLQVCQAVISKPSCQCDIGFVRNDRGKCRKCLTDS